MSEEIQLTFTWWQVAAMFAVLSVLIVLVSAAAYREGYNHREDA